MVYTVPDSVPDDLTAGAQVIYGLERPEQTYGGDVVVQGAGALGLYAIAVAKARGARRVIAVDGVPERLELALAFGADEVVDLAAVPSARDRAKAARRLTGGRGADVVVEVVGQPAAINEGLAMLGQFGRYVEIGNIGIGQTVDFEPARFVFSNKTMIGVPLYDPIVLSRALDFLDR